MPGWLSRLIGRTAGRDAQAGPADPAVRAKPAKPVIPAASGPNPAPDRRVAAAAVFSARVSTSASASASARARATATATATATFDATGGPATAAASSPPPSVFGARRPLVGARGAVAGFELLLPPAVAQRLRRRGDAAALAAHHAALLAAAAPVCQSGRTALLTVSAESLCRPGVAQQAPGGVMLCVEGLQQVPPAVLTALRARRVRLGQAGGSPEGTVEPDFVLLTALSGGLDTLLLPAQRWQQSRPRLPLIATGLLHLDDVERVLRQGFQLAGGHLDRAGSAAPSRPLSAPAHRICRLLNHLLLDHDTAVVAEAVRGDAALSYRLLRYANSPALALRRSVDAIDDAVQLLGRRELQRWLQVMLLNAADARQASRALQEAALARGRLLESLAARRDGAPPATLFTVGLLSMLEVLLQVPLADALAPLHLGDAVQAALLRREGPYAEFLDLAEALDSSDPDDIDRLDRLAGDFGGIDAVCAASAEAWAWAASVAVEEGDKPRRA